MPKAPSAETVRERAHARALATVAALPKPERQVMPIVGDNVSPLTEQAGDASAQTRLPDLPETDMRSVSIDDLPREEPPLPETETQATVETQQPEELAETSEPQKKRGRGPAKPKPTQYESTFRSPDEDFFDYLERAITPEDWQSSKMSGIYIYKILQTGTLKLAKGIRKSISQEDVEEYAIKNGPGNYRVQVSHSLPHITRPLGTVVTFDEDALPAGSGKKRGTNTDDFLGASSMVQAMGNIAMKTAETGINAVKGQMERNQPLDVAALFQGFASIMATVQPKPQEDKTTPLIMAMLQNQAQDAERRAREAREESERRERQAKEDATNARERDNQFFQLMLKQAETKADSLNQMTGLLTSFMKVKETIDDTMGGGPKGPWDLVAQVADGVIQNGPAIAAAIKGASPQQVAQMQNPQPQPAPEAQPFYDMIIRLAKYFQRDPANYNGPYLVDMIEAEYGGVHIEIINQPKDDVLKAIAAFEPWGKAIMEHPQASVFMAKIIDAIKADPDTMDEIFPDEDEPPQRENPPMIHGKARKINGRAKGAA
jgi:hypothetical protein